MNTATQKALIELLECLKLQSRNLAVAYSAEVDDACTNVIEALINDSTITETK